MKSFFIEQPPVRIAPPLGNPSGVLFGSSDVLDTEQEILARIESMPPGSLLPVDFAEVRVATSAARQLLRRAIRRITGGELADRYLVLQNLGVSREHIEIMLEADGLTVVERKGASTSTLLGRVDPAMAATYDYLTSRSTTTARDVQQRFELPNISTATNRLTNLTKLGLARRVDEQPVAGGGRQFIYAPVR